MRSVAIVLLCCLLAWACVPSSVPSEAQEYGPNVISDLMGFDTVVSSATTHDLIVGQDGKRYRIISLFVRSNSSTANSIYFGEEGVSATVFGTNSSHKETLDQLGLRGKVGWSVAPGGRWYETSTAGTDFEITLSADQDVAVVGTYVEIR